MRSETITLPAATARRRAVPLQLVWSTLLGRVRCNDTAPAALLRHLAIRFANENARETVVDSRVTRSAFDRTLCRSRLAWALAANRVVRTAASPEWLHPANRSWVR